MCISSTLIVAIATGRTRLKMPCPLSSAGHYKGCGWDGRGLIKKIRAHSPDLYLCTSPHACFLTFVFLSSLSSCAGFLKTWLPFLMLMGIVLTVALALNLRWPGSKSRDMVETPSWVRCGADLLNNTGEGKPVTKTPHLWETIDGEDCPGHAWLLARAWSLALLPCGC